MYLLTFGLNYVGVKENSTSRNLDKTLTGRQTDHAQRVLRQLKWRKFKGNTGRTISRYPEIESQYYTS